jgi:hypothetical protein
MSRSFSNYSMSQTSAYWTAWHAHACTHACTHTHTHTHTHTQTLTYTHTQEPSDYSEFRKMVIGFVMATDLSKQRAMCDEFKTTFAPESAGVCRSCGVVRSRLSRCSRQTRCVLSRCRIASKPILLCAGMVAAETKLQRSILLRHAVMCADLNHATRPLERHIVWSQLLLEEFEFQAEEAALLAITSVVSLPTTLGALATSQCGFITFLVQPVFFVWERFWCTGTFLSDRLATALHCWRALCVCSLASCSGAHPFTPHTMCSHAPYNGGLEMVPQCTAPPAAGGAVYGNVCSLRCEQETMHWGVLRLRLPMRLRLLKA